MHPDSPIENAPDSPSVGTLKLPCIMVYNSNDPCGAGGIGADLTTIASASGYGLPVIAGTYVRDTSGIRDHFAMDDEVVDEQARCALEDVEVLAFKVGFLGNPDIVGTVAEIASDYSEVPLVAYMSDLAWMDDLSRDNYLDAFEELLLPQATVLVGNHSSLCRWLLPEWQADKPPGPRDIARAAAEHGVPYTLTTGVHGSDGFLESHLATAESVLVTARYERFEATYAGAGDTLSAALAALLAAGADLPTAVTEALTYLDRCLDAGFQPGMGHAVPDRMFWAHDDEESEDASDDTQGPLLFPLDDTRH